LCSLRRETTTRTTPLDGLYLTTGYVYCDECSDEPPLDGYPD